MDAPLQEALAMLAIGQLRSNELPELATQALLRGVDSPSLRELAGLNQQDVRDARDALEQAAEELGLHRMAPEEAIWYLIDRKLRATVLGHLPPAEAADWIWTVSNDVELEGDLRIFVGLASELEDHPDARTEIEHAILSEAREFLARPGPRRWVTVQALEQGYLWKRSPNGMTPIQTDDLPVSADLKMAIGEWFVRFQGTLGEVPATSGFTSQEDAEAFVAAGSILTRRLQDELGTGWHVVYMPEPVRPPGLRVRRSGWWRAVWRS